MSKDLTTLHIRVAPEVAEALAAEATLRHLSLEEVAAERLARGARGSTVKSKVDYSSFFGAGKGRPGAFGSVEAIDKFVSDMRNEW